jgi:hypothetical protein
MLYPSLGAVWIGLPVDVVHHLCSNNIIIPPVHSIEHGDPVKNDRTTSCPVDPCRTRWARAEKQADIYMEVREMERGWSGRLAVRPSETDEEPLRLLLLVEPVSVHLKLEGPTTTWHCLQPAAGEITSHALTEHAENAGQDRRGVDFIAPIIKY